MEQLMREPDIGTEVSGTVPETGDRVEGTYVGSFSHGRHGVAMALLIVDGKRVAVEYNSLADES
jgi:hypothetical protein